MQKTLASEEEKNKEAEHTRRAAMWKLASEIVEGVVQQDVEADTQNQNQIRGGLGRVHGLRCEDFAENVPALAASIVRRMAAEENIPLESIVQLTIVDWTASKGPAHDVTKQVARLFGHLNMPKLLLYLCIFSRGGATKQNAEANAGSNS